MNAYQSRTPAITGRNKNKEICSAIDNGRKERDRERRSVTKTNAEKNNRTCRTRKRWLCLMDKGYRKTNTPLLCCDDFGADDLPFPGIFRTRQPVGRAGRLHPRSRLNTLGGEPLDPLLASVKLAVDPHPFLFGGAASLLVDFKQLYVDGVGQVP